MTGHLLIFGLGYTGRAIAALARAQGWQVTATIRAPTTAPPGITLLPFAEAAAILPQTTHIISTIPPDETQDPVLATHGPALSAAPNLRWACYLSTTGVYGDRAGAWVDEHTTPTPQTPRAHRRLAAEQAWRALNRPLDLFRLGGIYGPGRSALNDLRAHTARAIDAPNHLFGRIHRDDIAGAALAAATQPPTAPRILHGVDNEPAPSADVIIHAAHLLGIPPPHPIPLTEAWPSMSPMARSFWSENRRVASRLTQHWLARPWLYPTYREGLAQIFST